jgi:hypothetical protein
VRDHCKRTLDNHWISGLRQPIESTFNSLKDQMRLEDRKAITVQGLQRRVAQRLLGLGAATWDNRQLGSPPHTRALRTPAPSALRLLIWNTSFTEFQVLE